MNDRAALDLLLERGPLSRTRLGKLTGLSKPTASQLLARLEAAGLVIATGTGTDGSGTADPGSGPHRQLLATYAVLGAALLGLDHMDAPRSVTRACTLLGALRRRVTRHPPHLLESPPRTRSNPQGTEPDRSAYS